MSSKSLVWLITGCSAGFGLSLSLTALKAGHRVIATSCNPSKSPDLVKQVENLGGIWLPLDVTASPAELQAVVDQGKEKFGRIDVLVNNAGIGILGPLEDINDKEKRSMMDTNFFGPFNLIQILLPSMREQKSGIIVNFSSAAGLDPRPAMSMYGATKWALEGMSQALAKEVAPFGIRVLIVQPGAFRTNMPDAITLTSAPLTPAYKETEVGQFRKAFSAKPGQRDFTKMAMSDVEKGCLGIFEVVTGTGRGEGKERYPRLPLSEDCAQRTLEQAERLKAGYEAFKDVWESTKEDDAKGTTLKR